MTKHYKGDDYDAFDQEWALIEVDIPEDWVVSKAEFRVGDLPKMVFFNPEFPIPVSLNSAQTSNLRDYNTCYLAIYDEKGRKQTCDGSWTFFANDEVV
jgi:hypothetical protein